MGPLTAGGHWANINSMIVEILERFQTGKGLAQVFKALGDESRLAIFQLLRERCAGGCELTEDGADRTVTEIAKATDFWAAEDYHQDYLAKNPGGYTCHYLRE